MMKADNDQFLSYLFEELKGPMTIFLGAGSSLEGAARDGSRFLNFGDLQEKIIMEFGSKEQKEAVSASSGSIDFNIFLEVINQLDQENKSSSILRNWLGGHPGLAHYQLAAATVSNSNNLFLILTTNYDELFDRAMRHICEHGAVDFRVYSPQQIETAGIDRLVRELPVLIKLFGDLGLYRPRFRENDLLEIIYKKHDILQGLLMRPMLFIGYSFRDKLLSEVILRDGGPVYIVDPNMVMPETSRRVRHFQGTFGDFMRAFLAKMRDRSSDLHRKVDDLLRRVEPETKFRRFAEVEPIVQALNDRGFGVVEDRFFLKASHAKDQNFLVERKEAAAWVDGFIKSDYPLMLLLGESGLGKSCFLYTVATGSRGDVAVSFFAGATLVGENGLFGRLSSEFSVPIEKIKPLLQHLDALLTKDGTEKIWMIIIDGLNESSDHATLWEQIVAVSGWNLRHIKILYSCRTVFWDGAQLANHRLEKLHYGGWSCVIGAFTPEETALAYNEYRQRLNIASAFEDIEPRVRAYLANPLMMRIIVTTYQGEKLQDYIPATSVFDTYWKHLKERSKSRNSPLDMDVLTVFAHHKVRNFRDVSINRDDLFHLDDFIEYASVTSVAIRAWEDEGVLLWVDDKEQRFRFSFDRFYEYCLSKVLIREYERQARSDVVEWILEKHADFQSNNVHFSYHEALKSVLVDFGLRGMTLDLRPLVAKIPQYLYRVFAQQCLRELLFETDQPVIETIETVIADHQGRDTEVFLEAELTLAANSPKVIPSALRGIFSGDDLRAHRCIQLLLSLDAGHAEEVGRKAREVLCAAGALDGRLAKGLVNLYIFSFCRTERGQDALDSLKQASGDFLGTVVRLPGYRETLSRTMIEMIQTQGPYLFSTTSRDGDTPFDYPWTRMGATERDYALRVGQAIGKEFIDLTHEDFEAIRFFSMEVPRVDQMTGPRPDGLPKKYPLESMVGRWIFIRHGRQHFDEIIEILDGFMKTNDFCTSDYCIGIVAEILMHRYTPQDPQYRRGYEHLSAWVEYFHAHVDGFFDVLNRDDAFTNTYNPLEETGMIFANLNPHAPSNIFIDRWIQSDDVRCRKLGLLAVRRLWQRTGKQALVSARGLFQSEDPEIQRWLNGLMKELSLLNRRLFEQFLDGLSLPAARILEIENTEPEMARAHNYSASALARMFFCHDRGRIRGVTEWHRKIYESPSLDTYLSDLVSEILDRQEEAYLSRQPAFSDP